MVSTIRNIRFHSFYASKHTFNGESKKMRNFSRRLFIMLSLIASCSTVLASCQVSDGNKIEDIKNLDTTITWWNNYIEPKDPATANKTGFAEYFYEQEVIEGFNKIYPDIKVKTVYKGNYAKIASEINTAISVGNQPNIASVYGNSVAGFLKNNATLSLDSYVTNSDYGFGKGVDDNGNIVEDSSTSLDDINQSYLNAEKSQYQGNHYYSMPYSKSGESLVINKDVFEAEGSKAAGSDAYDSKGALAYKAPISSSAKKKYNVPTNWKELIATARQMKIDYPNLFSTEKQYNSDGLFYAVPFCYESSQNMFISFAEMMDIPYSSNSSSNVNDQILFNNDKAKELVVQLKKWNNEGLICTQNQLPKTSDVYHEYASSMLSYGRAFMVIVSTTHARYFSVTNNENDKGGYIASMEETPVIDENCYDGKTEEVTNSKSKVISQGPSLTFFKKNDEKQNLASFLFYKYLTNTENSSKLAAQTAYFPIRNSSYNSEAIQNIVSDGKKELTEDNSYQERIKTYTGQAFNLNTTYTQEDRYFLSPVFDLSADCRTAVGNIIDTIFNNKNIKTDEEIRNAVDAAFNNAYNAVITQANS